jgi:hypothetical protein
MFKKTITYEDFNGETQTKDFYFHMSKAELLDLAADGDAMTERLKRIIADNNGKAILREFRVLIMTSCGIRSEDGNRFLKTPEAQSELLDSPAFDALLMELCTKADASADFVRQLIPEKMQKEMQEQLAKAPKNVETVDPFKDTMSLHEDPRPTWLKEGRNPTEKELMDMGPEELRMAFRHRR